MNNIGEENLTGECGWILANLTEIILQETLLDAFLILTTPFFSLVSISQSDTVPFQLPRIVSHGVLDLCLDPLCLQLLIFGDFVQHVDDVEDGRCWDQHNLEDPEAQMWDGGESVIADVAAARLQCIAGELGLLIAVHSISNKGHQQDAKDQKHRQPDLTDDCRMILNLC